MNLRALDLSNLESDQPSWLHELRAEQRARFMKYGLPTQKQERWKYTNLDLLDQHSFSLVTPAPQINAERLDEYRLSADDTIRIVLVNGQLDKDLSDLSALPTGVIACSMQTASKQHAEYLQAHLKQDIDPTQHPFVSLNTALFRDGLFLYVPDNVTLNTPLHLLNVTCVEQPSLINLSHLLVLGKHASLTCLQEYISLNNGVYFNNVVTRVIANRGAILHKTKLQTESSAALHLENTLITQQQDSDISMTSLGCEALFSRDDTTAFLNESGAKCRTSAFYYTKYDQQYVDHHVDVEHKAQHTHSEMLYKGIVDKKSRAVFNGRLYVDKCAQKTSALQTNHHLLLSGKAEAYAKPELEIYADDVKCRHGATTGQLDADALFYLRARGIEEAEARQILLAGFADDIFQGVDNALLRHYVRRRGDS